MGCLNHTYTCPVQDKLEEGVVDLPVGGPVGTGDIIRKGGTCFGRVVGGTWPPSAHELP